MKTKLPLLLCALLAVACLGNSCSTTPKPSPYPMMLGEITNGVTVVMYSSGQPAPMPAALAQRLQSAGAKQVSANEWRFDAITTEEQRDALTAALLRGAHLKGNAP